MTQSIVSSMKSSEIFKTNQAKTYLPLILDRKIMTIKFIETKIILKEYIEHNKDQNKLNEPTTWTMMKNKFITIFQFCHSSRHVTGYLVSD